MPITPFPIKKGILTNPSPAEYLSTQEASAAFDLESAQRVAQISAEAADRFNADSALGNAINTKASATALSTEQSARVSADNALAASLSNKADTATVTAALGLKADTTALTAGLTSKLNTSEVVSDPALPTANNGKVLTQFTVKTYVAAQVSAAVAFPDYLEISVNTVLNESNIKPGFLHTIRNTSVSAVTLIFSGTYAFYSVSKLDFVDTGGGICQIPALTTVEVSITGTQVFVRRKSPSIVGSKAANISSVLYQDSFITISWDGPNRQPTYIYNDSNILGIQWLNRTVTCEVIAGNTSNTTGTSPARFSGGRDITVSPGVARYFTRSGLIDAANVMANYGSRMVCTVMKELYNAAMPAYKVEIIMGDNFNISYVITVIRN